MSCERAPWWALAGVHTNLRGRWIVNGASGDAVRFDLSTPVEGRRSAARVWDGLGGDKTPGQSPFLCARSSTDRASDYGPEICQRSALTR